MDTHVRLPGIESLLAAQARPADETTSPSSSSSLSSSSAASAFPAAPTLDRSSWIAVNHLRTSPSRPAPPPPSYVLSPPDGGRLAPAALSSSPPIHDRTTMASDSHARSAPRQPLREVPIAPRPSTSGRQDSAVSESPASHPPAARVSEADADTPAAQSVAHSSPPSRAALPSQSPDYSMTRPVTPARTRALSDADVSPSSLPTTSARSPAQSTSGEGARRGSMAPPPHPSVVAPAASPAGPAPSNETAAPSTSVPAPVPELPEATPATHARGDSSTRCLRCGAVWHYPAIGPELVTHTQGATSSLEEQLKQQHRNADSIRRHIDQYNFARAQAYEEWERQHQPAQATESNKRKSNLLSDDDGHVCTKFRRLSCASPLQSSQLTPPPDQRSSSSPPPSSHEHHHADQLPNNIDPNSHIARILGIHRPNQFHGPSTNSPPDTGGMFDAAGQRRSVERGSSRGTSPIK